MKKLVFIFLLLIVKVGFSQLLEKEQLDTARTFFNLEKALENPDQVFILKLSKKKLKKFPKEIFQFKNLNKLTLSKNKIEVIPDSIDMLPYLQEIDFSDNKIERFPDAICTLKHLTSLNINQNYLENIPICIENLQKLKRMDLWGNCIADFPYELGNLDNLEWVDFRVILMNDRTQEIIMDLLPNAKVYLSNPCTCNIKGFPDPFDE